MKVIRDECQSRLNKKPCPKCVGSGLTEFRATGLDGDPLLSLGPCETCNGMGTIDNKVFAIIALPQGRCIAHPRQSEPLPNHLYETWIWIAQFIHREHCVPSNTQVSDGLGIGSYTAAYRLRGLRERGYIIRPDSKKKLAWTLFIWPPLDKIT